MSKKISWDEVYRRLGHAPPGRLYGIPRGGAIIAGLTRRAVDRIDEADWIVDDVVDSGATSRLHGYGKPVWGLFDRARDRIGDRQLIFPWEDRGSQVVRQARLERLGRDLIETLGYDPHEQGLLETPARWARWWTESLNDPHARTDTAFDELVAGQLVVVSPIPLWSVCEHHLLPFYVELSIGYLPQGRLLGLSKFARVAHAISHRLQLQERLATEVASELARLTGSDDLIILARGRHLCMESRGVRTAAVTSSLIVRGRFEVDSALRTDFLTLTGPTTDTAGVESSVL